MISPTTRPLRIGMLGIAHLHAEVYAPILQELPAVELIGIADYDHTRGADFARRQNLRHYASAEQLLQEQPDAVVICSENVHHADDIMRAAEQGCAVLCEKPLTLTEQSANEAISVCTRRNVPLMTAFPMRFAAPIEALRAGIAGGGYGHISCCSATNCGQIPSNQRRWFVDAGAAGGGALIDHSVHVVDLARWIFASEPCRVYAHANRILHLNRSAVETGAQLLIDFEDGTFLALDCSWRRPDRWPSWGGLTMRLIAEHAIIELDAFAQNLQVNGLTKQHARWDYWGMDANRAMLAHFVASVREGRRPLVDGNDGLQATRLFAAAYRSLRTGAPEPIEQVA